MSTRFTAVEVGGWAPEGEETLGTKTKVWLRAPDGRRWLFKQPRPNSGEDWAEKACAELATLLGIPHAEVELACRGETPGSISRDFTHDGETRMWRLALGNELLWKVDATYPREARTERRYTVDRVLDVFIEHGARRQPLPDANVLSAPEIFVGYLLFDAWVANQDRHHENFGMLFPIDATVALTPVLAPSFDHAAALGQILRDEERHGRLGTTDQGYALAAWTKRAHGPLYGSEADSKPLGTFDVFQRARRRYPDGARYWLGKLAEIESSMCSEILAAFPDGRPTAVSRTFAARMLDLNREHLLSLPSP